MKKISFLLVAVVIAFTGCSTSDNDISQVPTKEVSLNMVNLIHDQTGFGFESARILTEFPDYSHPVPKSFNVYFVYDGTFIKFNNITEGNHTFRIPPRNYKVVVTSFNMDSNVYGGRDALPLYSDKLHLYGESTIDYSKVASGSVELTNDYSAVMLLKDGVKENPLPTLNSNKFCVLDDYYSLYTRLRSGNNLQFQDFRGTAFNQTRDFEANKVYRFKVGKTGELSIHVQDNIFSDILDEIL